MTKERRFIVVSDEQGYQPGPGILCWILDNTTGNPVYPAKGIECSDMRWADAIELCRALNQLQEDYDRYNKLSQKEGV